MTILKVATFNIHLTLDRWPQRRGLVVGQLLDVEADIIALQEVAIPIRQARWLMRQLNARIPDDQPHYALVSTRRPGIYFAEGLAILSRLPILSSDKLNLGLGRVALRANIELPTGETVDVVNLHLYSRPTGRQAREEQVVRLASWLDMGGAVRQRVLLGSFRASPDELAIQKLKAVYGYRSAYEMVHRHEPLATWPTALRTYRTNVGKCDDYLFVSRHVKGVISAEICCHHPFDSESNIYPSDHVGLAATIEFDDR
ncbi:MAG: endonuclease/exonuclease/phosphatase family protein [Candidatus Promineifilaceae bacterium]